MHFRPTMFLTCDGFMGTWPRCELGSICACRVSHHPLLRASAGALGTYGGLLYPSKSVNSVISDCKNHFEEIKNNRMTESDCGRNIKAHLERLSKKAPLSRCHLSSRQGRHCLRIC